MATLGARALIDLALPTGVDGSEILKFELRDGTSAQEVIALAATAIGVVNEELVRKYGNLIFITEEQWSRHTQGETTRRETPLKTEFVPTDGVRASEIGHMFPSRDYEDALAWTRLYLRRSYRPQIEADIQLIADSWMNRVEKDILTRALTNTENAIGSAGYDVPWAIGTGTNVNYIPPQFGGNIFSSSHTHFRFLDDATSDWDDMFELLVEELRHHGFSGRLAALVSGSDLAEIKAVAGFVELNPQGITVIAGNTAAPVRVAQGEFTAMPGELFGYYNSLRGLVELYYNDRMPANYSFMTHPFGVDNPRNGLAVRTEPGVGFGLRVIPMVTQSLAPELEKITFEATHGPAVNDRLNGVAGYLNTGAVSYVNPTIS